MRGEGAEGSFVRRRDASLFTEGFGRCVTPHRVFRAVFRAVPSAPCAVPGLRGRWRQDGAYRQDGARSEEGARCVEGARCEEGACGSMEPGRTREVGARLNEFAWLRVRVG